VEDDGPGVPESAWEKIFTPFLRLDDSRTRASGGHGLGLSIVRRIIYWHGGRALIGKSNNLGGACFSLSWPRIGPSGALGIDPLQRRWLAQALSSCPSSSAKLRRSSVPWPTRLDRSVSKRNRTAPASDHSSTSACSK
jgi:hypothetical protein